MRKLTIVLLISFLLTACGREEYRVNDMRLIQFEPKEGHTYGIAYFEDEYNEKYKLLLYEGDFKMMMIGQQYDITYVKNTFGLFDYSITKYSPSHLNSRGLE